MKKLIRELNYFSRVIVVGMVLGISIHFAVAWQEPTQNPPGGNLGAPINTSAIPQTKNGGLTLKGGYLGLDSDLVNGKFAYINQTSNSGNLLYSLGLNRSSVQGTSAPDIYGSNGNLVLGGDMNGAGNIYLQADGIKNCSGSLQTDANGKVVCGGGGGGEDLGPHFKTFTKEVILKDNEWYSTLGMVQNESPVSKFGVECQYPYLKVVSCDLKVTGDSIELRNDHLSAMYDGQTSVAYDVRKIRFKVNPGDTGAVRNLNSGSWLLFWKIINQPNSISLYNIESCKVNYQSAFGNNTPYVAAFGDVNIWIEALCAK